MAVRDLGTCVICGSRPATTVDHLPASTAFPKPRPQNPVTVPACEPCNSGSSRDDQAFAVYLSLHVGLKSEHTQRLWQEHVRPTLRSNRRLQRSIIEKSQRVLLTTPSGLLAGQRQTFEFDETVHQRVIERMVRGYYYHHFREVLGDRATCQVQLLTGLTKEILDFSKLLSSGKIGNDYLLYRYGRAVDDPCRSIWIFEFYGVHWSSGVTTPR